jgi:tetratricopeptide (TPR) repeat protein
LAEPQDDVEPDELSAELASPTTPNLAEALAMELMGPGLDEPAAKQGSRQKPGAGGDTPSRHSARNFLDKQSRMLDIQMEHLHEQRDLVLAHLRLRKINETFKVALQVMTCFVGAAVVAVIAGMALQAWRSHSLVIEPFRTPADMAQRGLDGTALASRLLDKLRGLQDATDSARSADSFAQSWGEDIKIEIPETGVSVGEVQAYLRNWLGHDSHISGEAYRGWAPQVPGAPAPRPASPDAIYLTVRAGEVAGVTLQGREEDIDGLIQQAAERLFAVTQPYRWSVYLARNGRVPEAIKVLTRLAESGPKEERAWANSYLGGMLIVSTGDIRAAEAKERTALALDPDLAIARDNMAGQEFALGHDHAALASLKRETGLLSAGHGGQLSEKVRPAMRAWAQARAAATLGDFAGAADGAAQVRGLPDYQGIADAALQEQAAALALQHDPAAARAVLAEAGPPDPAAAFDNAISWGSPAVAQADIDEALGDWAAAVRDLEAAQGAADKGKLPAAAIRTAVWPALAYARARAGDIPGGRALAASTPLDCYACVLTRGRIAALARDWPDAERWLAEAARQAPDLPFADQAWGELLLARGDAKGAIARFQKAHRLGPRYADPLEGWGEALMATGDFRAAAARFAEAARLAPRWTRLELQWSRALSRLGRADEARAHAARAASLR